MVKKFTVGLLAAVMLLGASFTYVEAQNVSMSQLIDLFISLGIIAPDKAAAARAAVANPASVNSGSGSGSSGAGNTTGPGTGPNSIVFLNHSADTDKNWIISDSELASFQTLYDYRVGTSRTGDYSASNSSATLQTIVYVAGPNGIRTVATHSGDSNRDWKIDLRELTRVIELKNSAGYKVQAGTEDGFAPISGTPSCYARSINGYNVPSRNNGESVTAYQTTSILNGTRVSSVTFACANGNFIAGAEIADIRCNSGYASVGTTCSLINQASVYHSADTDKNWVISSTELNSFQTLYDYRVGTSRTGDYSIGVNIHGGDSIFVPGPGIRTGATHSGDSNRDWKIDLRELTRVIELKNAGGYKVQAGTEDGFAPIPKTRRPLACGRKGDLDRDGYIDQTDYEVLGNVVVGNVASTNEVSDLNGDGRITVSDWVLLGRYVNGLDSTFPACGSSSTDLYANTAAKADFHPYGFTVNLCVVGSKSVNDLKKENSSLTSFPMDIITYDLWGREYKEGASSSGFTEDLKNGSCASIGVTLQSGQYAAYDQTRKVTFRIDPLNLIAETNEQNDYSIVTEPKVATCTDSDGGININVAGLTDGRVNGIGSYFNDSSVGANGGSCSGDSCTGVAEGYCSNGAVTNYVYQCSSGYSANGACATRPVTPVVITAPTLSTSSWHSDDPSTWPTVSTPSTLTSNQAIRVKTANGTQYLELARGANSGKLTSSPAAGTTQVLVYVYDYALNAYAVNERAVSVNVTLKPVTATCTDSDGGVNINVAGLTDGRVNGLGSYFNDSSVGSNGGACSGTSCTGVAEGYCSNGAVTNTVYQCPSGYSAGGACATRPVVQVSAPTLSTTSWYADDSSTWPYVSTQSSLTSNQAIRVKHPNGTQYFEAARGTMSGRLTNSPAAGTTQLLLYIYDYSQNAYLVNERAVDVNVMMTPQPPEPEPEPEPEPIYEEQSLGGGLQAAAAFFGFEEVLNFFKSLR